MSLEWLLEGGRRKESRSETLLLATQLETLASEAGT
jgi:hypothetical protein